ncbi:hypothetical protein FOZG_18174 [Fusarium oxysporum Fo47]|uniref:Uncharacterized protein n=1 Tax=Fusarium oxysporum Fo47 TaxID=660027 RepID=W9J7U0_FUSOX|nr:hypothetical protein FOZG_18174 [Fusarium oxysporum Fo47]
MDNHLLEAQGTLSPNHEGGVIIVQTRGKVATSRIFGYPVIHPARGTPRPPNQHDTNTAAILTDLLHQDMALASIESIELQHPANTAAAALPSAPLIEDVVEATLDFVHIGPNATAAPAAEA